MPWVYLFIASVFEIGWVFSLKFIDFSALKKLPAATWWSNYGNTSMVVLPFFGYVFFGIGNIFFFSLAMKQIPASTAFAVWMAVALAGMRLVEFFVFKENSSISDLICFALLIIGIIGLKK